jgi:uncharacterized protein YndB with AHSA1/START domain
VPKVSAEINASPRQVWEIIGDSKRLNEWFSPVKAIRGAEAPQAIEAGSDLKVRMVGRLPLAHLKVHEAVAERKLRAALGPFFAHRIGTPMRAEITVEPSGDGSNVSVEISCHPITGALQQRISGVDPGHEAPATLARIKELAEGSGS